MLRTDLPDHRRATEDELVAALRNRDPLALAEAYHRTIPAAHATARRLLSGSAEVEALLRQVYSELWSDPPHGAALEGWIRGRCFVLAAEDLRERDAAPASPSLTVLLPELPRPEVRYLDAAERALADLTAEQRRALLLAHDRGIPSRDHDDEDAHHALLEALLVLAGPEAGAEALDPGACGDIDGVGDWVLGLLAPRDAATVAEQVSAGADCTALTKALRRGRRRLEGLPPTPDMGQRVLVVVLAGAPASPRPAAPMGIPSALDAGTGPIDRVDVPGPDQVPPGTDTEFTEVVDTTGASSQSPTGIYAELAALDAADTAAPPHPLDGEHTDTEHHDGEGPDDEHLPPRRSFASRLLVWVLAALFMVAGVAAGLYLGLTLLS